MEGVKIYGLCLERLRHQISMAKNKLEEQAVTGSEHFLLESYRTGEPEEIIDILELYDLDDKSLDLLHEKLEELADTVSVLLRERLVFGYTDEGHFGLYLAACRQAPVLEEILTAVS